MFQIGADGVDTNKIVEDIRTTVAQKAEHGSYADPRVGRAERTNLKNLADGDGFLNFYLECLHDAVFVDISDFQIHERRTVLTRPLILLKKVIWKLLKFYTYRLWSQQNEINGLLLSATETIDNKYRDKIIALEKKIAALEGRDQKPSNG
jgi:hypothetical protein